MSRRKQAKPRTLLKMDGDIEQRTDDEVGPANIKDQLSSDPDSCDDKENQMDVCQSTHENGNDERHETIDAVASEIKSNSSNSSNSARDCGRNVKAMKSKSDIEMDDIDDDNDDDDDNDNDNDNDDDDLSSMESYYSEMYSTHTSSSYSPSASDGTLTPNSLTQHHAVMPPVSTLATIYPCPNDDVNIVTMQTQCLPPQKLNGQLDEAVESFEGGNTSKRISQARDDHKDNDKDNGNDNGTVTGRHLGNGRSRNCDVYQQQHQYPYQQQHQHQHHHPHHHQSKRHGRYHRHSEHFIRMPSKVRKIEGDSESCSSDFNKLSSDTIRLNDTTTITTTTTTTTTTNTNTNSSSLSALSALSAISAISSLSTAIITSATTTLTTTTGTTSAATSAAASADGSYQCQFCDKSFPRLGYLKKHEQSHAEHLPFKCEYCARLFKHKRSRDRHTKLHTGDRRYRCPHCEAAFSRSDHLKIHMKTHDNQKPFQCTICNRGYNTAAALTSHMQNHKKQAALLASGGSTQNLNYSPRSTGSNSSSGSLQRRRYNAVTGSTSGTGSTGGTGSTNGATGITSPIQLDATRQGRSQATNFLKCTFCIKSDFMNMEQLNAHLQNMHEKDYVKSVTMNVNSRATSNDNTLPPDATATFQLTCEYCTMKFANIAVMLQHMRTTHMDRLTSPNSYFDHFNRLAASGTFSPRLPAAASFKSTNNASENLIKEENGFNTAKSLDNIKDKVNDDDEPTDLSQTSRRSQSPPVETTGQHPLCNVNDKPHMYFCNQCNAGLPDFNSFRDHLHSHLAQNVQLVCQHCGLVLHQQSDYERHFTSHFLIKNSEYKCPEGDCQKTFSISEELQKHLTDQHTILLHKCVLCGDIFESKVSLQVHFACAHIEEVNILRCSACMDTFRNENEFQVHVKARHPPINPSPAPSSNNNSHLHCTFCRTVCSSDLEMQFHLAAHARQFRCPSCPETFHVEFLLDRHMQTHHTTVEQKTEEVPATPTSSVPPINSLYVNALLNATPNNNNTILDYNIAFASHLNKGIFPSPTTVPKLYNSLQIDTNTIKHSALIYGLSQRYFDTSRTIMDMYAQNQSEKAGTNEDYFKSPTAEAVQSGRPELATSNAFSCGICERSDFKSESEVHSHRKIVHNLKTGVSLRCAYCLGNFKSRNELEHHMKTCHNSSGKHKCLICDEIFPSPAILAEHKLQHSKVGQSGKCSHCLRLLPDINAFKSHLNVHNTEGQMPVQCICCRQTLHSDFEVGLHAKFHVKAPSVIENVCALCLEPISGKHSADVKICEKCCFKHNLHNKFKQQENFEQPPSALNQFIENRCNLCRMILPHQQKLREHLIEHTFAGCEERGFNCYICSAVFTATSGLLTHMTEHGLNARPYDCNICPEKFYFRAELDHHLIDHDSKASRLRPDTISKPIAPNNNSKNTFVKPIKRNKDKDKDKDKMAIKLNDVKQEIVETEGPCNALDDDEYIEVEKLNDASHMECATPIDIHKQKVPDSDCPNRTSIL